MKKLIYLNLLLFSSFLFAQQYQLTNKSFENINGALPHEAFTQQNLGNSWYAHRGTPDSQPSGFNLVNAPHGDRFAHVWHRVDNLGGSTNWKRTGESFFMYYPMQAGSTYNLKFKLKKESNYSHFYVIATNGTTPNFSNAPSTHDMDTNLSNNIMNVVGSGDIVVNNISTSSGWQQINVNYTATQNYTQLLFIPYIDINTANYANKMSRAFVDDVHFTGNLGPSNLSMILNGADSNTNVGITICSGEDVILDASQTVDTYESLAYFIQIHKKNANGTTANWFTQWYPGLPYNLINLSQLYPNGFTAPEGGSSEYHVKLAMNSGPSNTWFEKVMKIIVHGGPSFHFGVNLVAHPGQTTTRKVLGLPSGSYSYKWYEGTNTNSPVISTSNIIYINKPVQGNYPYTVTVTDNNTGCSTTKTTNVLYLKKNTIDPYEELGPLKQANPVYQVYPNPVKSNLNIKSTEPFDFIKIYSLDGIQVGESDKQNINVNSLRGGIYIVKIYNKNQIVSTQKFIKN